MIDEKSEMIGIFRSFWEMIFRSFPEMICEISIMIEIPISIKMTAMFDRYEERFVQKLIMNLVMSTMSIGEMQKFRHYIRPRNLADQRVVLNLSWPWTWPVLDQVLIQYIIYCKCWETDCQLRHCTDGNEVEMLLYDYSMKKFIHYVWKG